MQNALISGLSFLAVPLTGSGTGSSTSSTSGGGGGASGWADIFAALTATQEAEAVETPTVESGDGQPGDGSLRDALGLLGEIAPRGVPPFLERLRDLIAESSTQTGSAGEIPDIAAQVPPGLVEALEGLIGAMNSAGDSAAVTGTPRDSRPRLAEAIRAALENRQPVGVAAHSGAGVTTEGGQSPILPTTAIPPASSQTLSSATLRMLSSVDPGTNAPPAKMVDPGSGGRNVPAEGASLAIGEPRQQGDGRATSSSLGPVADIIAQGTPQQRRGVQEPQATVARATPEADLPRLAPGADHAVQKPGAPEGSPQQRDGTPKGFSGAEDTSAAATRRAASAETAASNGATSQSSPPQYAAQGLAQASATPVVVAGAEAAGQMAVVAADIGAMGEVRAGAPGQPVSSVATPQTGPATAQNVAAQIAEVSRPQPDGPVELTLRPEELGRLKLSFLGGDAGMVVTVAAERPETLDLLRRHIDILAQEMRKLGHEGAQFNFTGGESAMSGGDPRGGDGAGQGENRLSLALDGEFTARDGAAATTQAMRLGTAGLDLRL